MGPSMVSTVTGAGAAVASSGRSRRKNSIGIVGPLEPGRATDIPVTRATRTPAGTRVRRQTRPGCDHSALNRCLVPAGATLRPAHRSARHLASLRRRVGSFWATLQLHFSRHAAILSKRNRLVAPPTEGASDMSTTALDTDRIERTVLINASRDRVWRAISNAEDFGTWFGANLRGQNFAPGKRARGQITICGHEDVWFDVVVERVEPQTVLSY